jgi:hypothetical protein
MTMTKADGMGTSFDVENTQEESGIKKQVWLPGPSSKTLKRRKKALPIKKRMLPANVWAITRCCSPVFG